MPEVSFDVEIYCSCGEGLCNQSTSGRNRSSSYITVEPCEKCLSNKNDKGYDKGYDEGIKDGKATND